MCGDCEGEFFTMVAEVRIRPFDWQRDWRPLLSIIYESWFFEDPPLVGYISAARFGLHYISKATDCMVAEGKDGEMLGFLAYDNKSAQPYLKATGKGAWQCAAMEYLSHIGLYVLPKAQVSRLFSDLFEINYDKLRRMAPHPTWPEFVLLIVSPHAKRMGIGRKLIAAGEAQLKSQGYSQYYLLTDSSCDYQFYDRLKMQRVVDVAMDFTLRHIQNYDYYLNTYLRCYIYERTLEDK